MKHAAESKLKFSKKIIILLVIFVILIIITLISPKKPKTIINNNDDIENISRETNKEVIKQLVIKKTDDTICNQQTTYSFNSDDVIIEIKTVEEYKDKEKYEEYKQKYLNRVDIEVLETIDEELKIVYHKVDFSVDKGLNYEQIKEKYMSITGAYEIVE